MTLFSRRGFTIASLSTLAASVPIAGVLNILRIREIKFSEPPKMRLGTNSSHEQKVAEIIRSYSKHYALPASAKVAVSCYDWRNKQSICQINSTEQMQLASVVKVFIAAAYLKQNEINPDKFPLNDDIKKVINTMIVNSDNKLANLLIDRIGGVEKVCSALKTVGIDCNIIEKIPGTGTTYQNTATADNITKLYGVLLNHEIPNSDIVLDALKNSKRSRLFSLKTTISRGNKTGTTDCAMNDTGFLENLIIVVMVTQERPDKVERSSLTFFHSEVANVFFDQLKVDSITQNFSQH